MIKDLEKKNQELNKKYSELKVIHTRMMGFALYKLAVKEADNSRVTGTAFREDFNFYGKDLLYKWEIWSQGGWSLYFITQMRQHYEDLIR